MHSLSHRSLQFPFLIVLVWGLTTTDSFTSTNTRKGRSVVSVHNDQILHSSLQDTASSSGSPWFTPSSTTQSSWSIDQLKIQILQLGAALDRGQAYNPTSGEYYSGTMDIAKEKIRSLINMGDPNKNIPKKLEDISGEWELVLTTVRHGIFRSSPFFLAVQEAFGYADEKGWFIKKN